MSGTIERIEREAGIPGLAALLAEKIAPTDLQSLLLEVYSHLAQRAPSAVLADYESNRFVKPSPVSPLVFVEWEQIAYSSLPPEFKAVALSPVCPLGTCSAVGLVDQDKVLSTSRNTEVVADSTNVLALECAWQRRLSLKANPKSQEQVHLATSHRLLRTQNYNNPNAVTHFSSFALCSAGRDQGNLRFELSALTLQIGFYLRSLRAFIGADVPLRVALTDLRANDQASTLSTQLFESIQREFSGIECAMANDRTGGRDYYTDFCFHIYATTSAGERMELVDGGAVNWTQKLLSNAKERCVISGIGSERLCAVFRP